MVKCGRLLMEKYPNLIWVGCLAHTLHLFVNDILKIEAISQYFDKTIKQSQILKATFEEISKAKNINISLSLPVKTRWGSYLKTLVNLSACKMVLQNMAVNDEETKTFSKNLKQLILNDNIWSEIEELKQLLKPIVK